MNTDQKNKLAFIGTGLELFGIMIVNLLLSLITFGIYNFWGKASVLRYIYSKINFDGSELKFHGLGAELFFGFLRLIVVIIPLYTFVALAMYIENKLLTSISILLMNVAFLFLVPISIHGRMKYRMSRTSWRGIHFGYRGNLKKIISLCLKGAILSAITLGIYSSFFTVNLRKYIYSNTRLGNVTFRYDGKGLDLFLIHLKGIILSALTFGIYMFWYTKNNFNYLYGRLVIIQDDVETPVVSDATSGEVFKLMFFNMIILIFTLGLGYTWVLVRNINFVFDNIKISENFDTSKIEQTEEEYKNAFGEDMSSSFDFNYDIGIL